MTRLVDVRHYPGSRAYPDVGRDALTRWLPAGGVDYRWEERLCGRRRLPAESPDKWWRIDTFRAYANHMRSAEFLEAISSLFAELQTATTAVMCSESQWWRCHRRLIADFATLTAALRCSTSTTTVGSPNTRWRLEPACLPKVCLSTTCPEAAPQSGIDYRAR